MEPSILLHETKGLNPKFCLCPRCGQDNGELALVGANDRVYTCPDCEKLIYGGKASYVCPGCKSFRHKKFHHQIEEHERIPGSICKACEEEMEQHAKIVAEGGVYFRCKGCGRNGVVIASSYLSKVVREHSGIEPPNPVGVETDDCQACCGHDNWQPFKRADDGCDNSGDP